MQSQNHPIVYYDFDLLIQRSGERYVATVVDSPGGQGRQDFDFPFSQREIEEFYSIVDHPRGFRHKRSEWRGRVQVLGEKLFRNVFNGQVEECFGKSKSRLTGMDVTGRRYGLRIRFQFGDDVPELANLPWEYLYNPEYGFLALSELSPIVRHLRLSNPRRHPEGTSPLRILAVVPQPSDESEFINVEKEWDNLNSELQALSKHGLVELARVDPPTLQGLQRTLRKNKYHIFHFMGHGSFDEESETGLLLFEREDGRSEWVSSEHLSVILQDHVYLQVAVLNACEGATASSNDRFSGTAQRLLRRGIPAVVGMQFKISDRAAISFARELYSTIVEGYPLEAAIAHGRKALYSERDVEWGTPVLYSWADPLVLFAHDQETEAPATPVDSPGEPRPPAKPPVPPVSAVPPAARSIWSNPTALMIRYWRWLMSSFALLSLILLWVSIQIRYPADPPSARLAIQVFAMQHDSSQIVESLGTVRLIRENLNLSSPYAGRRGAIFRNLEMSEGDSITLTFDIKGFAPRTVQRAIKGPELRVALLPLPVRQARGRVRIGRYGEGVPSLFVNDSLWGKLDTLSYVSVPAGIAKLRLQLGACLWDTTVVIGEGQTATIGKRKPTC